MTGENHGHIEDALLEAFVKLNPTYKGQPETQQVLRWWKEE